MMTMTERWKRVCADPVFRFSILARRGFYNWMSDERFLKKRYLLFMKRPLNLDNPQTFTEKIQWLKLHNRKPEYVAMVDKFAAKDYVSGVIGPEYVIPSYGVWNHFDEIDFDALPEQFVLKPTHDSGSVIACTEKSAFDMESARRKIERSLKRQYYWGSREWAYKDVKPRVLAEKYMEELTLHDLRDYKIHCFNGVPMYLQVIGNRNLSAHTGNELYYDFDWKAAGWTFNTYPAYPHALERPQHLEEMRRVAEKLSQSIPYVRVDLYEIGGKVYFGELTLYAGGGFYRYGGNWNYETDKMIGEWIHLSV